MTYFAPGTRQRTQMDILRLALLSLAAAIAVIFGASLLFEADRSVRDNPPQMVQNPNASRDNELVAARAKIEAHIAADAPDYMRFFKHLKEMLPAEYDTILTGFAQQQLEGADMSNVDSLLSDAVRALRLSNGALAAKSPKLCVDFLYGGASPAFFDFSSKNRALVADMAIAGLDAINNGRRNRIERPPPSDADFTLLEDSLKAKQLSGVEISAILDGKAPPTPIPDSRMCQVGEIYLDSLAALPEPARFRIYGLAVELMARS
jgi:hypothetical protein